MLHTEGRSVFTGLAAGVVGSRLLASCTSLLSTPVDKHPKPAGRAADAPVGGIRGPSMMPEKGTRTRAAARRAPTVCLLRARRCLYDLETHPHESDLSA